MTTNRAGRNIYASLFGGRIKADTAPSIPREHLLLSHPEKQGARHKLHHEIGVVEPHPHAFGSATEERPYQIFRFVSKPGSVVGDDDGRPVGKIDTDADVNRPAKSSGLVRPAHLEPVERIVEQIVQRSKEQSEDTVHCGVGSIVFEGWAIQPNAVFAKSHPIDVANSPNQLLETDGTAWSLAQQVGKSPEDTCQFSRSGADGLAATAFFDQSAQCLYSVFNLMKDDCETYTGQPGAQHGVSQFVVLVLDFVDQWLEYVFHLVFARRFAKFLKRLSDALCFRVPAAFCQLANFVLVLLSFNLQRSQRSENDSSQPIERRVLLEALPVRFLLQLVARLKREIDRSYDYVSADVAGWCVYPTQIEGQPIVSRFPVVVDADAVPINSDATVFVEIVLDKSAFT